jgi:hypothetical protein
MPTLLGRLVAPIGLLGREAREIVARKSGRLAHDRHGTGLQSMLCIQCMPNAVVPVPIRQKTVGDLVTKPYFGGNNTDCVRRPEVKMSLSNATGARHAEEKALVESTRHKEVAPSDLARTPNDWLIAD